MKRASRENTAGAGAAARSHAGQRFLPLLINDSNIHYRAYPIELGGKSCVQLQVIGTNEGSVDWDDDTPRPFLVCSHEMKDGNLILSKLNEELVGDELKTTAALQEAFLKNKDNPQLFGEPTVYRQVKAD